MSGSTGSQTPPLAWDELARTAARRGEAPAQPELVRQLLSFSIGDTPYAVPVESVREIVRLRPITPIPRVERYVRGVISLRGEVIQVIDLAQRLGQPPAELKRASRIVVIHTEDGRVAGFLVDGVREVLRAAEDAFLPASGGEQTLVEALCVRGQEFVSLIDLERMLDVDDER